LYWKMCCASRCFYPFPRERFAARTVKDFARTAAEI